MSNERDPRVDPRPGDVLAKDGRERRVDTLIFNIGRRAHALLWQRSRNHQLRRCDIETWRTWARDAEIVWVRNAEVIARGEP